MMADQGSTMHELHRFVSLYAYKLSSECTCELPSTHYLLLSILGIFPEKHPLWTVILVMFSLVDVFLGNLSWIKGPFSGMK